METRKHVCSFEQAKKLKKIGLFQFSYVHYYEGQYKTVLWDKVGELYFRHAGTKPNYPKGWDGYCSAYTTTELGEMLPEWVYSKKNSGGGERWVCMMVEGHVRIPKKTKLKDFYAETEPEARAEMLIHLLKNKLISINKLNILLKK